MNTVKIDDSDFIETDAYKDFMNENSGYGFLRIRAWAASQAVPIGGLRVTVSKVIDNIKVIFFDGVTDSSGIIRQISLPAPKTNSDNLEVPKFTTYQIIAEDSSDSMNSVYSVNIYDGVTVLQNIIAVPNTNMINRNDIYGY